MQQIDPSFALNGTTLAAIGTILTALGGAIGILFQKYASSKDAEIESLREERDYYRDRVFESLDQAERGAQVAEQAAILAKSLKS